MKAEHKHLIGWILGIAVLLFFAFVNVQLEKKEAMIFGVVLFTVILWIFEPVPVFASTLLMFVLLSFTGMTGKQVFAGFSDTSFSLVIAVFVFGAGMRVSGLGRRLALFILSKIRASYGGLVLGILVVGTALTFLIPSSVAKSAMILPVVLAIAVEMGEKANSDGMAGLTLSTLYAGWTTAGFIPTGAVTNLILLGVLTNSLPEYIRYATYSGWLFLLAVPTAFILTATWVILVTMFKPQQTSVSKGIILAEYKKLPAKLTSNEVKGLIYAVGTAALWATGSLTGIATWVPGVLVSALMFFPRIGLLKLDEIKNLDWATIIWMGGILTITAAIGDSGIAAWMANLLMPLLVPFAGNVYTLTIIITMGFMILSVVIVNPQILAAVLLSPLVTLAPDLNIDPMLFVGLFLLLFRCFIFAYQCQPSVILYGMANKEGYNMKQLTKASLAQALIMLPVALLSVLYWSIVGIL